MSGVITHLVVTSFPSHTFTGNIYIVIYDNERSLRHRLGMFSELGLLSSLVRLLIAQGIWHETF